MELEDVIGKLQTDSRSIALRCIGVRGSWHFGIDGSSEVPNALDVNEDSTSCSYRGALMELLG